MKKFSIGFSLLLLMGCKNGFNEKRQIGGGIPFDLRNQCIKEKQAFKSEFKGGHKRISEVFVLPQEKSCLFLIDLSFGTMATRRYVYDYLHEKKLDIETHQVSATGDKNLLYPEDHKRFEANLKKLRKGVNPY